MIGITIALAAITAGLTWLAIKAREEWQEICCAVVGVIFGFAFIFIAVAIPIEYLGYNQTLREIEATRATVKAARDASAPANMGLIDVGRTIERAALTHSIVDANAKLAEIKWKANNWFFNDVTPERVKHIKPLR
jgi:hypothetical protein